MVDPDQTVPYDFSLHGLLRPSSQNTSSFLGYIDISRRRHLTARHWFGNVIPQCSGEEGVTGIILV